MSALTPEQIAALWVKAGGSLASAPSAVAHALAESGGQAAVTSSNPDGGTNVGIWQLDTRGVGAGHTTSQLSDPLTNARLTVKATGNGRNWGQWSGDPGPFASQAQAGVSALRARAAKHPGGLSAAIGTVLGGLAAGVAGAAAGAAGGAGSILSWPGQIVDAFSSAGQAIDWLLQPSHWVRIFAFVFGVASTLAGMAMLARVGG